MAEKVSIHTPTKGVTLADEEGRILPYCFNPHTHEGCDTTFVEHSSDYFSFNPHTHEGGDVIDNQSMQLSGVSIHTPTKGVTACCPGVRSNDGVSIHTPTKGVTA